MARWGVYRSMYDCDYPPEWDEDDETYEDEDGEEPSEEDLAEQEASSLWEQERAEQRRIEQEAHEHPWKGGRR